jgi:ABC-2 type transport system permease protein
MNHELVRILRIWPQTILPPVITTILYYIIFGSVIGPRIGEMNGYSYIQFIMPGLVMMNVIDVAYVNVNSSFFSSKFFRSIEEMLITPMSDNTIIFGYVAGGMIRAIFVGLLVAGMSLFFTKITVFNWPLTVLIVILTAIFLSLVGFVAGVFAKKFDDLFIVPLFVLTPLSYFGGVFYSIDLLPPTWRTLTYANPLFYMISGFRYAILGINDVPIHYVFFLLIGGITIMYGFSYWLLKKGTGIKY